MDGVATPIIGRPRPLPGHDTPNPAYHPHTLNYEEPVYNVVRFGLKSFCLLRANSRAQRTRPGLSVHVCAVVVVWVGGFA